MRAALGLAACLLLAAAALPAQQTTAPPPQVQTAPVPAAPAAPAPAADAGQGLFYAMPGAAAVRSLSVNVTRIGIFAPQSFSLDRYGRLRGAVPPELLITAHAANVPVMPLVVNAGFSRRNAERLLRSASAHDHAIGALVEAARAQRFIGWQVDFENLPSSQRAAFSRFIADLAGALHRHHLQLSVAVAARTSDDADSNNFRGFSGVYDYRALARSADFLSVMAYPEHSGSDPGPLASTPWVEQVIQHELTEMPAEKLSLGIPTYQTDWMQRRVRITWRRRVAGKIHHFYRTVFRLFHRSGPVQMGPMEWDPALQSAYRISGSGHDRQVTWVENERSFRAKLALVERYHLRGFSVWRLGLEDPNIWADLAAVHHDPAAVAPPALPQLQIQPAAHLP